MNGTMGNLMENVQIVVKKLLREKLLWDATGPLEFVRPVGQHLVMKVVEN